MGAYEELWCQPRQSFRKLAALFRVKPLPSDHVENSVAAQRNREVASIFNQRGVANFNFIVQGDSFYPAGLRDAMHPVQCLYCRGDLSLLQAPLRIAVVGSRCASSQGLRRTRDLVRRLVENDNAVVVSGLARGIDTAAHRAAIRAGGRTIAVVATPLGDVYPPENSNLQGEIARHHLLISQVPVIRYSRQDFRANRAFFPERNVTMAALSDAAVIVEAADKSGTVGKGRAIVQQKRKLFIMNNCFAGDFEWPENFRRQGAIRLKSYQDFTGYMQTCRPQRMPVSGKDRSGKSRCG